jgi:predicted RNase H-like nuclease (RuvC/YqgF family)
MGKLKPSYNDLKMQNAGLLSALTKIEEDIRVKGVEFIGACFVNQGRTGFSYEYLLNENERLTTEAKNHAYQLECARENHISDLKSLLKNSARMQKRIENLEQENQELKNQVEKYEMQNAGESW